MAYHHFEELWMTPHRELYVMVYFIRLEIRSNSMLHIEGFWIREC